MNCTLSGDYFDEDCTALQVKTVIARKSHRCGECRKEIVKGEKYETQTLLYDGDISRHKTCLDCVSIRDAFYPHGGYMFENVMDSVGEQVVFQLHGEVDSKCILPLTDKAKDVVFAMIEEAWGMCAD
jgi:hypothetical protein